MRPIDADALRSELESWGMNDYDPLDFIEELDDAPTLDVPTLDGMTRQQADIIRQALPDLKKDIDEIITMKDTFIYHLVMDAIERKIREVEKAMRNE